MTEPKNAIIEESEDLLLNRIATVTDNRGGQFLVNLDAAAIAVAQLFSDFDNEHRFGWQLNEGWYVDRLALLRAACFVMPGNGEKHGG